MRRSRAVALGSAACLAIASLALSGCKRSGGGASTSGDGTAVAASPAPPFNENAAFDLLKQQVAFGPRVPGTPGHQKQLDWMVQYLKQRADTVILQPFAAKDTATGKMMQLTNVIARFKLSASDRILLLAHWDTRPTADNEPDPARRKQPILGANDGGSGVAVLMQLADDLKRHSPPLGVDLLFVDGEDYTGDMYLGSVQFAQTWGTTYHPLYGILLDMIGDQNPVFPIEPNSQDAAPEVVQRVYDTAERIGLGKYFPRTPGTPVEDDHFPLNKAGIHTIDLIDFDYQGAGCHGTSAAGGPCWHTLDDDVAHTSAEGLGVVGKVVKALIYAGG